MHVPESQAHFRAQCLREAFEHLKRDQADASNLFQSVQVTLAECPVVGASHALYNRWEAICQDYGKNVEVTRRNASKCATHLSQCALVLPRIIEPEVTLEDKRHIVGLFLSEAQKGQKKASRCEDQFNQLAERVAAFMHDLRTEIRKRKIYWHDIKTLCIRAFDFLTRIAFYTEIIFMGVDPSRPVASYYNIRKKLRTFEWYRRLEEQPEFARDIAWQAVGDCLHLRDSLSSITHAWREVGLCCNELATVLDLADKSLELMIVPFIQHYVGQVDVIFDPLVEALRAYSSNRVPAW